MSWALVSTAAAGLNAGAGLYCALVEHPSVSDATVVDSYYNVFNATSGPKLAMSNGLSALSAGAALAQYVSAGDDADPAWLTCALVAGAIPLYNLLVLQPTAAVVTSPALAEQTPRERESWVSSFGRKSMVSAALAAGAFGCTLLVLGYNTELSDAAADARSSNPLRFRR